MWCIIWAAACLTSTTLSGLPMTTSSRQKQRLMAKFWPWEIPLCGKDLEAAAHPAQPCYNPKLWLLRDQHGRQAKASWESNAYRVGWNLRNSVSADEHLTDVDGFHIPQVCSQQVLILFLSLFLFLIISDKIIFTSVPCCEDGMLNSYWNSCALLFKL